MRADNGVLGVWFNQCLSASEKRLTVRATERAIQIEERMDKKKEKRKENGEEVN
jgi:hypothetical protein